MSCTTLLVGKNASYDGSTMIARNDDSGANGFTPKKFIVISSKEQKRKYKTVISHLEIDLPDHPMSYTAMPNTLGFEVIVSVAVIAIFSSLIPLAAQIPFPLTALGIAV